MIIYNINRFFTNNNYYKSGFEKNIKYFILIKKIFNVKFFGWL